ncbi:VOC family protein [Kitasatospora sp. NBC_00085]|uniref:VOC family protein n=1 Tax=unclassified Kitasatospora TaxID=2633591 RepID=UPI003254E93C
MPKAGRYRGGVPCWVELASGPDLGRARRFYGGLFGWEFVGADDGPGEGSENGPEDEPDDGPGGYTVATLRGAQVAGIARGPGGDGSAWLTYLAVDDADRVTEAVRQAGGRIVREPGEVAELGRSALAVDPLGAVFGLWQARLNPGAGLVNEPATFTWNEHLSPDPDGARAFYRQVLGYEYARPAGDYTVFRAGGQPAGGIGGNPGVDPDGPAALWAVYFGTADTDRTVERAVRLGGSVLDGPEPTPFGRVAVVRDDGGAAFTLITVPQGDSAEPAERAEPTDAAERGERAETA